MTMTTDPIRPLADLALRLQTIPELTDRPDLCRRIADDVAQLRESHRCMRWIESHGDANVPLRELAESVQATARSLFDRIGQFRREHAALDPLPGVPQMEDRAWALASAAREALEMIPAKPAKRPVNYEPHAIADRIARRLTEAGMTIDPTRKGTYSLTLCEALDGGTYTDDGAANRRLRETYAPRKRTTKRPAQRRAATVTKAATRRKSKR